MLVKLTDMSASIEGNKKAYKKLISEGMDSVLHCDILVEELFDSDSFNYAGNLINKFILSHPILKTSWEKMSADERWIFVEYVYYGIMTCSFPYAEKS